MNKHIKTCFLKSTLHKALIGVFSIHASLSFACCDIENQLQAGDVEDIAIYTSNVYNQLKTLGCNDSQRVAPLTGACSGDVFTTWSNVRALIHTANALEGTGQGPTEFSLDIDADGLIAALRWNAGEEFSSQEDMSTRFSGNQSSTLTSRISALRTGVAGFSLNGYTQPAQGMNAGDELWSPWGGFINASYSYGNLEASKREDAFDFDGQDINAGIDYRLNNHWVVGGILAYVSEKIDFDSSKSIVDGTVDMSGLGLNTFLLYQSDRWYFNMSGGYQTSEFDTNRSVRYTSLNVDIPSTNTVAISNNTGSTLSTSISGGYTFSITEKFSIEPSLSGNFQGLTIDAFTERDLNDDGFELQVAEQKFISREAVAATKMQYVMSNSFGVFTPYLDLQYFYQFNPDARRIKAAYANIADATTEDIQMSLLTDKQDTSYGAYSIGVASVLRGASQKTLDTPATGGIQAFIAYRELVATENYHHHMISAGMRYEF